MRELTHPHGIKALLEEAQVVAVLGAHPEPRRPAHYVPAYLHEQGYTILPVNAAKVGQDLFGAPVTATLAELKRTVDIVDIFRRSEAIPGHLDDILAMDPPPRAVWLQLGIRNDEVAAKLVEAGIEVVQNRCTLADHRSFGLSPKRGA